MFELSADTEAKINSLAQLGDQYAEEGEFTSAMDQYLLAWDLVPEPKTDWDAGLWLLVALADANFYLEDYSTAQEQLEIALTCEEGPGNPFIHLRLGQCLFESGEKKLAAKQFQAATTGAGLGIFDGEKQKYLDYYRTIK